MRDYSIKKQLHNRHILIPTVNPVFAIGEKSKRIFLLALNVQKIALYVSICDYSLKYIT